MHKSEFVVFSKRELNVNSLNSLSTYRQLHLVEPVMHSNLILTKAGPSQTARWRSPNPDCRIMPLVSRQNARLTTTTSARAQSLGSGSRSGRLGDRLHLVSTLRDDLNSCPGRRRGYGYA